MAVDAPKPLEVRRSAKLILLLMTLGACFISVGVYFAHIQTVWIDETTQIFGSRLSLGNMFSWLTGSPMALGVPPDRMPPVSYLIDTTCLHTGCNGEVPLRLLHLVLYCSGVGVLLWVIGRRWGLTATIAAAVVLIGTPQAVTTAVEIRAYPLFLGLTAVAVAQFIRMFDTPDLHGRRLVVFTFIAALLGYVHFFGLVAACALYCGLVVARARRRQELLWIGASWALTLTAAVGLIPFVTASRELSEGGATQAKTPLGLRGLALYVIRVIGHPAMDLFPPLLWLFLAGLAGLLVLSVVRILHLGPRPLLAASADPAAGLLVAMIAGFVATLIAAWFASGFDPLKPSYSVWQLPLLAALTASALVWTELRRVAVPLVGMLLIAAVGMQLLFVIHAGWFVQSPEDTLRQAIGDRAQGLAVIYVDDDWAYGYFPMVYRYKGHLSQYLKDSAGKVHAISRDGQVSDARVAPNRLQSQTRLLLVSIQTRTYRDMRQLLHHPPVGQPQPLPQAALPEFARWRVGRTVERQGLYWVRVTPLRRVDAP